MLKLKEKETYKDIFYTSKELALDYKKKQDFDEDKMIID